MPAAGSKISNDPERALALNYVPGKQQPMIEALWQLDEMLGRIVAITTETVIGQMRLTWWYDQLLALGVGKPPAEPLLTNLAAVVERHGVTGTELTSLVEGWEALLEPLPLSEATLMELAEKRGAALFRISTRMIDASAATATAETAGEGWALVDFATHCSDQITSDRARAMANQRLASIDKRIPKALRILARLARAKAGRTGHAISNPLPRFVFLRAVLG